MYYICTHALHPVMALETLTNTKLETLGVGANQNHHILTLAHLINQLLVHNNQRAPTFTKFKDKLFRPRTIF